ncbi:UxaA family hydrolase, partial [Staphylococcus aureus]
NQAPLYIKVHEIDNTAIIVNDGGLPKGTVFSCGLVLEEDVPQGHKVALTDLNQGDEIVRYGEVIGFADETIKRGSWIREALVRMPAPPALDDLPLANRVPQPR